VKGPAIVLVAGVLLAYGLAVGEEVLDLKLKSRREFAREGRETITKPVAKLRHLIPQSVYESSIIEREVSDGDPDG
jgi:hypothetical protein